MQAQGLIAWAGNLDASLPTPIARLTISGAMSQHLDLTDNTSAGLDAEHHSTMPSYAVPQLMRNQQGYLIRIRRSIEAQRGLARAQALVIPATESDRLRRPVATPHQHGQKLEAGSQALHAEAVRTRESISQAHQHGIKRKANSGIPHAETIKRRKSVGLAEQQAQPAGRGLGIGNKQAWPTGTRLEIRWTKADHPAPGYWWPIYKPPGLHLVIPCEGDYQPRPLHCDVILGPGYEPQPPCEIDPEPPHDTIIIPIREIYTVINTLTLTELDGTPVPAEDFSASIDADSWTWSWNTRIPASALAQVRPDSSTRVELIATINGEPLRVLVENIQRERRFGESWLRVSGRGRAAFLADPLAPVTQYTNTNAITAQQALNATLTTNGVPIGWTVDWQIEDWQIPAGIWSHSGTWIDAAKRIAEAGGAYVQSHDTDQTLRILPRYPVAPWNWNSATPDIALPEDVVEVEGIEWQEKPDYNAVWVHGGEQGRSDRIIVGTSGGTNPAPTIVDELATDPAMTRQRGLALLGDTGKQAQITLRLPVLPETGMIRPGTLIEYQEQGNTRRGLVRSLSISHSRPELWQTIGVETHE
ncbi:hypothetical protein [Marinobacter shengliensis]|uniref:Minor tail protein n=1 Tax=Marinobacter shengliensis TaxID=1389223 RepID=A0ABV4WCB9_9GAMM